MEDIKSSTKEKPDVINDFIIIVNFILKNWGKKTSSYSYWGWEIWLSSNNCQTILSLTNKANITVFDVIDSSKTTVTLLNSEGCTSQRWFLFSPNLH